MGLKKSLLLGTSLLLAATSMHARPINSSFDYTDRSDHFSYDDNRQNSNKKIRLSEYVDQYLVGENVLKVRKLLRMNKQYKGYKVKKVILFAASDRGRAKAQLMINGMPSSDRKIIGQYSEKLVFKLDNSQNVLGMDINKIQIRLKGRIDVEKITAVLVKPQNGRRTIEVTKEIYQSFRGFDYVSLDRKLAAHDGKKLVSVKVRGESRRGNGTVTLLVNGEAQGRPMRLSEFSDEVTLKVDAYSPAVLGRQIYSVELETNGNIFLEDAVIKLQGKGGHTQTPRQRKVKAHVGRNLQGPAQVSVSNLMKLDRRNKNRAVKSVIIKAHSAQDRARVQLVGQFGRLGAQRVGYQMTTLEFDVMGEAASDLKLKVGGDLRIESMTVVFDD